MVRCWYVVPVMRPDKRVAGPYANLADAETACIRYADRGTAVTDLAQGRMPARYTVRQFEVRIEAAHLYSHAAPPPPPPQAARQTNRLPFIVHTYSLTSLRVLCRALTLPLPTRWLDRREMIEYMECELDKLARR
jgi:hypothetical protein